MSSLFPYGMFELRRNAEEARRADRLRNIYHRGQELAWDGRDERGDRLANGAYLYQVEAQGKTSGRLVRFNGRAALVE